ncbi:hypothetical protein Kpho02_38550 [Kitasatospora phosalacinea]|uniref:DUF6924 domain-containing protein n=1 Tax=Kitasatospora phosalacinea TaxID=2065 RepID=A0A9W6QAP7_9ACTN|nr:hypothetical protein [Kitasatospora phosalacinea]GLW71556.1 hypothetical protein Kpho02_38550 [Kitasatospora phosalacinea]
MTHLRLPVVDPSAALVVRTDRTDPAAWRRLLTELRRLPTTPLHLVDDPGWADAGPLAVLASAAGQEDLSVVFLADRRTMRSPDLALLALDTSEEDEDDPEELDPAYYQDLIDRLRADPPVREFRLVPAAVDTVHGNLFLANLGFDELARRAAESPDGVLRA